MDYKTAVFILLFSCIVLIALGVFWYLGVQLYIDTKNTLDKYHDKKYKRKMAYIEQIEDTERKLTAQLNAQIERIKQLQ